jgi:hypothetical protein
LELALDNLLNLLNNLPASAQASDNLLINLNNSNPAVLAQVSVRVHHLEAPHLAQNRHSEALQPQVEVLLEAFQQPAEMLLEVEQQQVEVLLEV